MDSRFILACFLSFSFWFLVGFSQNLGDQQQDLSNQSLGKPGAMGNGSQGLEGLLENAQGLGGGSSGAMSCLQGLLPCKSYLKSSSPPSTCCDPLKEIVSKDAQCLCSVFDNPEILKSLNVTQDEALNLPKACGVEVDTSKCKADSPNSSSPTKPSPSSPSTDNSSNNNRNSSSQSAATTMNPQFSVFGFIAFFVCFVFLPF